MAYSSAVVRPRPCLPSLALRVRTAGEARVFSPPLNRVRLVIRNSDARRVHRLPVARGSGYRCHDVRNTTGPDVVCREDHGSGGRDR